MILVPPRRMSFVEALWPPMEQCRGADEGRLGLQRHTVLGLRLFQFVNRGELPVDEGRVGERPEVFGRRELWGIRREEVEVDMVGHAQA